MQIKIIKTASKVLSVSIIFSLLSILSNVLVQKYLNKEEVALFFLSISMIEVISVFAPFGQSDLINKMLIKDGLNAYNWKKFAYFTFLFIVVSNLVGTLTCWYFYSMHGAIIFVLIYFGALFLAGSSIVGGVLRCNENYNHSIISLRLYQGFFFFSF